MKNVLLLVFVLAACRSVVSQTTTVELQTYLDLHHPSDTSSIYIGKNVGLNYWEEFGERRNTFVGESSGNSLTYGFDNSFFGQSAGRKTTYGNSNSFFGKEAGYLNDEYSDNSFFGYRAGYETTGSGNSFFGTTSGRMISLGFNNSFFGTSAGYNSVSGSHNSFFGFMAGSSIQSDYNIAIGSNAGGVFESDDSYRLYIDVEQSDTPLIYGEFDNGLVTIHHGDSEMTPSANQGLRIKRASTTESWTLHTQSDGDLGFYYGTSGSAKMVLEPNGDVSFSGDVNAGNFPIAAQIKDLKKENMLLRKELASLKELFKAIQTELQNQYSEKNK